MKLQIDTEAREIIIQDENVSLGDIITWMKKHFSDWKEWEIVPKQEDNTWPWIPTYPQPNPMLPWNPVEPWVTTDGVGTIKCDNDNISVSNGCNNEKCHCDGSCKKNKDLFANPKYFNSDKTSLKNDSGDWYIQGAYGLQKIDDIESKSEHQLQGYY